MSAGLFDGEEDEDEGDSSPEDGENSSGQDEEEGGDRLSVNPPVRREDKKTVTQRNKEKKQKEEVRLFYTQRCINWYFISNNHMVINRPFSQMREPLAASREPAGNQNKAAKCIICLWT